MAFDANGNLISLTDSNGLTIFGRDARDRLTALTGPSNAAFQYGPLGRRIGKTVNGVVTSYLYDWVNPIQELSNASVTSVLPGLRIDEHFTRCVKIFIIFIASFITFLFIF